MPLSLKKMKMNNPTWDLALCLIAFGWFVLNAIMILRITFRMKLQITDADVSTDAINPITMTIFSMWMLDRFCTTWGITGDNKNETD